MRGVKQTQLDPLFVIFEQHLYNFQDPDMNRKDFVELVLRDYFNYLRKFNITVPKSLEVPILQELSSQIQTMLVKKIYGCLTIQDYQRQQPAALKRKIRGRYARMNRIRSVR